MKKPEALSRKLTGKIGPFSVILFRDNSTRVYPYRTECLSVVAAAAKNEYYCENDYPGAVIVKKMAEAVVIHICSSVMSSERYAH